MSEVEDISIHAAIEDMGWEERHKRIIHLLKQVLCEVIGLT